MWVPDELQSSRGLPYPSSWGKEDDSQTPDGDDDS